MYTSTALLTAATGYSYLTDTAFYDTQFPFIQLNNISTFFKCNAHGTATANTYFPEMNSFASAIDFF